MHAAARSSASLEQQSVWRRPDTRLRRRLPCCSGEGPATAASSRDEAEGLAWRYNWDDDGATLASKIRASFESNVARGEAGVDGALAALQIAAEDDALMSVAGVPLPLEPWLQRLESIADDVCSSLSQHSGRSPLDIVATVDGVFYGTHRFKPPGRGRGVLSSNTVVDMPGVHSDPAHAYAHTALVKRTALPPLLALLYSDVWRRVYARGAVNFAIHIPLASTDEVPVAVPLPHLHLGGSIAINTWPAADALVQLLRHLKRCYWTHAWDTSLDDPACGPYGAGGGFLSIAASLLGGDEGQDAATVAISRTAAHRLARGIWTSSGGGDVRRARAACERLVLLLDQQRKCDSDAQCAEIAHARERRDLGAMLILSGDVAAARSHLEACAAYAPAMATFTTAERAALEQLIQALPELEQAPRQPVRRRGLPW